MDSTAEQQLVSRAKGGDTVAFEAILAPLIEPAHRFACALLHDPDLAEDAVQEAAVRAWRKLSRLRPGSPLRPWFLGIVANQCRDQMRSRWWQVIRMPEPRATSSTLPEDLTLRRAELRETFMKLRDGERRVLVLRLYLDLPWPDVNESLIERELRAALNETYRPAPELLRASMAAIRDKQPRRRSWTWVAGVVAVLLAVGTVTVFVSSRKNTNPHGNPGNPANASLPKPVPQPVTRTTPGAQVAWLSVYTNSQSYLVAVDPSGRLVARLDQSTAPGSAGAYGVWRSADGSTVFTLGSDKITAYSALDGTVQRTYARAPGSVVSDAFSRDGHWLAVLLFDTVSPDCPHSCPIALALQVIDLRTGSAQMVPVGHDPNANSGVWGMVVFAPNSARVYTLTWGGQIRLSAFSLDSGKLRQTAVAVDGQAGCAAPAMAASIIAGGTTLVAFCHGDGAVWFFDLGTLRSSGVIRANQANPFWLSPIFTPDRQLLYLHGLSPGLGDSMQVVDLTSRKLLGPLPTPIKVDQSGPFAWLITNAYAGGVASTVPISPDGLRLYSTTDYNGVMVLRVPDLKPIAKLAPGFTASEVWVSGDGRTIYAISDDGQHLMIMGDDGSHQRLVILPSPAGGFVASEHG